MKRFGPEYPFESRDGSSLLAVLFFLVLTSLTIAVIFSVTNSHVVATRRTVNKAIADVYADGVLESLFDQWRQAMSTVTNATDRNGGMTNAELTAALAAPTSTALPPPPDVSLLSWSVTSQTPMLLPTTDPNGPAYPGKRDAVPRAHPPLLSRQRHRAISWR